MQAWELQEGGVLTLVKRAAPQAEPEHIVVRMRAVSLNYHDVLVARNTYRVPSRLPLIPLSDGTGEVVEVGANVRRVQVGDRVAGVFIPGWIEGAFSPEKAASVLGGGNVDGVLAELVVLPEQGVVRVPEHLTFEEAATLPCAGVTAWYALFEGGSLKAGQTVLLLGTGGVSMFALQFAKLVGARAIITSSSDAKLTRAAQLGADETINYKTVPDWGKRVQELTGVVLQKFSYPLCIVIY